MILYKYLKNKFPTIPKPCITNDGIGCKWCLSYGGVWFNGMKICLADDGDYFYIDAQFLKVNDGHRDHEESFKIKQKNWCSGQPSYSHLDRYKTLRLKEIGEALSRFSRYRTLDEKQRLGESNPKYNFRIFKDYTPINFKSFVTWR